MSDRPYISGVRQCEYWDRADPWPECYVYVVQAEGDSPVKIGKANDPVERLPEIQLGNPRPLRVLSVIPGPEALERRFHRKLRADRMSGEWFAGFKTDVFLRWADQLAEQMILSHMITGEVPDAEEFIGPDRYQPKKRREVAPVTVKYVVPDPLSPEEVKQRAREIEDRRLRAF